MAEEQQRKKGRDLTDEQKEKFAQLNQAQKQAETDPKVGRAVRAAPRGRPRRRPPGRTRALRAAGG